MEVSGREQTVDPAKERSALESLGDDRPDVWLVKQFAHEEIEQPGEPGYRRSEDDPPSTEHPAGVAESLETVGPLHEVVERPEREDGVERAAFLVQLAGVADLGGDAGMG